MPTLAHSEALDVYVQYPMDDGDAVLLLDEAVCLELEQPHDGGDRAALLDGLVRTLRASCSTVLLAVARTGRRSRSADLLLWTELCVALQDSGVELLPLALLPAAPPSLTSEPPAHP